MDWLSPVRGQWPPPCSNRKSHHGKARNCHCDRGRRREIRGHNRALWSSFTPQYTGLLLKAVGPGTKNGPIMFSMLIFLALMCWSPQRWCMGGAACCQSGLQAGSLRPISSASLTALPKTRNS